MIRILTYIKGCHQIYFFCFVSQAKVFLYIGSPIFFFTVYITSLSRLMDHQVFHLLFFGFLIPKLAEVCLFLSFLILKVRIWYSLIQVSKIDSRIVGLHIVFALLDYPLFRCGYPQKTFLLPLFPSVSLSRLKVLFSLGAIMFGDSLLPSECSLIVEELKATSLCFQVKLVACMIIFFSLF